MRNPLSAISAAIGLGILLLAPAGCSEQDVVHEHFSPDVVAVTAPDSLAPGQALVVKVHWRMLRTCQALDTFGVNALDDTTIELIARGVETIDPSKPCTQADSIVEGSVTLAAGQLPAKRFHVQVFGAAQRYDLAIQGGAAPAALERHQVLVENAVGGTVPVQGATARVIDLNSLETLAVLTTDADGEASVALPCPGADRPYQLWVTGASGRQVHLYFRQNPARCGIPERTDTRF